MHRLVYLTSDTIPGNPDRKREIPDNMKCSRSRFFVLFAMTAMSCAIADRAHTTATVRQSFDIQVPWIPAPVVIAGQQQLIYELHLTNFAGDSLALSQIEVLNSASGTVLRRIQGRELASIMGRFDHSVGATDKLVISPGVRVVVYVSLPIEFPEGSEQTLIHRIEFDVLSKTPERAVVEGGALKIRHEPLQSLGPPLRGGPWVAVYNASWELGHRRVPYAVQGSVHIPGRFAIDWMKVDKNGKYFDNNGSKVSDWYGYGADVLAVTDSIVAATRDGIAEQSTVVEGELRVSLEFASGNYIALDLGDGRYAFYEHLEPGSILVKKGDHVRRGSVIGQLGYTGQSTGPHLHFHVSDHNSPLDAEGLPYGLQNFRILGAYLSPATFGQALPWTPISVGADSERHNELPAPFAVVEFPED
jgi:murein DD-endopeptidase